MGRAGSPIYKGEPGDYDLPFVRSFQLFCPIKISIFSPIAATLASSPFAVSLPPSPLSALSSQATLHTVTSTVPNPVILPLLTLALFCYTATAFSPLLFLSVSLPPPFPPPLSLSPLSPPTLFRFQYSIIGYASARGPFAKSGKRSRLRFLRAHKRARVSLPSYGCRLTVREEGNRGRERERERETEREKERRGKGESGRGVKRRASWQKSETNEQHSVRRSFPCKCNRAPGSRNGHDTRCDTQCFKEPNRIEGT